MEKTRLHLPLFLTLFAGTGFADVLNVRGPNPDFQQIKFAVNTAQDGDVIRIWPGSYLAFGINDKSLALVSQGGAGTVLVTGTARIRNLAKDRTVTFSGIDATGADGIGLVVSDCLGSVRIRDGIFEGAGPSTNHSPFHAGGNLGVSVLFSEDVVFNRCSVRGGAAGFDNAAGPGGTAMNSEDSFVSLFECDLAGVFGTTEDSPGESGHAGGSGLVAWGVGRVYASGCNFIGANGSNADWDVDFFTNEYGFGGSGGDGYNGTTVDGRFLDCTFVAGYGGSSPDSSRNGLNGVLHSGAVLLPGFAPLLWASPLTDDESSIAVRFQGAPGDTVSLRIATGPAYAYSAVLGPLLINGPPAPAIAAWRILGQIPASGILETSFTPRDLGPFTHQTLFLQGRVAGSLPYYTSSSWTEVLDAAW